MENQPEDKKIQILYSALLMLGWLVVSPINPVFIAPPDSSGSKIGQLEALRG